jgi:ribonuclease P protein component
MLSPANRLQKEEVDGVFRRGKPLFVMHLGARFERNADQVTKFSFLIAKKYAKKASQRNHFKRLAREAARSLQKNWPEGYNIVVFAKEKPIRLSKKSLEVSLSAILEKIH